MTGAPKPNETGVLPPRGRAVSHARSHSGWRRHRPRCGRGVRSWRPRPPPTGAPAPRSGAVVAGRRSAGSCWRRCRAGCPPARTPSTRRRSMRHPARCRSTLFESDRPPETRAVTPAPNTGTGVTVAPIQPFVFAPSIAPRLGIDMPTVPSGGYSEMTITTALPAAPKAKGDDVGRPDEPDRRRRLRCVRGRVRRRNRRSVGVDHTRHRDRCQRRRLTSSAPRTFRDRVIDSGHRDR